MVLYACLWFIMKPEGDEGDPEEVCALMIGEKEDVIQKALVGWRAPTSASTTRLTAFLDKHAAQEMPRVALRYAVEKS